MRLDFFFFGINRAHTDRNVSDCTSHVSGVISSSDTACISFVGVQNDSEWDRKEDKGGFHVLVVTHLATYISGI